LALFITEDYIRPRWELDQQHSVHPELQETPSISVRDSGVRFRVRADKCRRDPTKKKY
jgi:hypothetical protein